MALLIETLKNKHVRNDFECGQPMLDNYIKFQAGQDSKRNISVCYVISESDTDLVVGYYTLSSHSILLDTLSESVRSKLPASYTNIPTALLGRLAVIKEYQGMQIGKILLIDALNRCAALAEQIGTLAVVVDPINEVALSFYEAFGFVNLPDSRRMFMPIKTIVASQF